MNQFLCNPKIKPEHLARKAIVYLRQSSEKQVRQNKESQRLQYDVAERIRNLGWKAVEIIGTDLGSSAGIASARREGFERVLSSVALGEVGIVGSWEVSRLSRISADGNRQKLMTIDAVEFIRRFLLHVLPRGFIKIRHFGFLANRNRRDALALCRTLLPKLPQQNPATDKQQSAAERKCPLCKIGTLHIIERISAEDLITGRVVLAIFDTS